MRAKVEMLEETSKAARSNDQRIVVVNRALELLDETSGAERFDLAERAAKAGQTAVGRLKDAELRKELASRRKDLEKQSKLYETREKELAEARRTLEQKPDDESANETLGTYLCFDRNDWAAGLKHLTKAVSRPLRESAAADLKGASDSESQMTIGDGWWNLAETAKQHRNQLGFRSRAAFWYSKALPELTGLAKSKVENRLKDAAEALEIAYRQEENGGGKHRATFLLAPGVPLVLVKIPASADGKVKSFWLGQTEVTEAQWAAVVADGTRHSSLPKGDVNIADVNGFLGRINTLNARWVVRLPRPNEAEWAIGDVSQYGLDTVWYSENSGNNVHEVGTKRPNALGLYDIIGNAWEWCEGGQIYGAAFFDTREGLGVRLHTPADGDNRRARDVGFRVAADVR
jgi:hypothetical protein